MNNWLPALFNIGRKQNILSLFGRRRNNRGMIGASLLGLGVSAAAYGLGRNRNTNMLRPAQNLINRFQTRTAGRMPNMAALPEFSKELVPNENPLAKK